MDLQYISDAQGRHTAIIIPIEEWNRMIAKHEDLKPLEEPNTNASHSSANAARFKGLITNGGSR